jgi:phenylalanyl-tRNA synthetase beta chain
VTEAASPNHLPLRRDVTLRRARLQRVLGYLPPETDIGNSLRRLGMEAEVTAEGWNVRPPSYRHDIALEADLVEEVVRITGYDGIPKTIPGGAIHLAGVPEGGMAPLVRAREVLVQRGYQEAITYSFIDAETNRRLRPDCVPIVLSNPISTDMAVMRASLWGGLCKALVHNLSRQQQRVRLFEIGGSFKKDGEKTIQMNRIAGIVCGTSWPEQWSSKARPADLFDVLGDVQALLAALAPRSDIQMRRIDDPALHPGQAAGLVQQDHLVARCGALHPELLRYFDLHGRIFAFEVELDFVRSGGAPRYQPQSKFPSVRRDLSLTVDRALPVADLMECVRATAPETLRHLQLFDVYEGEGIDSGKKSVALGLIFQGTSSTLIDKDIDVVIAAVVRRLAKQFGAKLRDF